MTILIGGTVAIDHIATQQQQRQNLMGGSAAFAAIASRITSNYFKQSKLAIHLVSTIGDDYPTANLQFLRDNHINLSAVEINKLPSFSWSGKYSSDMNQRETLAVELAILEQWQINLPAETPPADVVLLANMSPINQWQMLTSEAAKNAFIITDTMDLWIEHNYQELQRVVAKTDLFILNESEALQYTKATTLTAAGSQLISAGPRFVIIKLGAFGALLFDRDSPAQQHHLAFTLPAYPIAKLNDPTGAGDCFVGALAGEIASQVNSANTTSSTIKQGMIKGAVISSLCCEDFGVNALQHITDAIINDRIDYLDNITQWSR